jgi:hypothetical protein
MQAIQKLGLGLGLGFGLGLGLGLGLRLCFGLGLGLGLGLSLGLGLGFGLGIKIFGNQATGRIIGREKMRRKKTVLLAQDTNCPASNCARNIAFLIQQNH